MKRGILIYGVLLILLILGQGLRAPADWASAYCNLHFKLLGFQKKMLEIKDSRFDQTFSMNYHIAGAGSQIVILHDLSDNVQSWYNIVASLVTDHQVVLMEIDSDEKNVVLDFFLLREALSHLSEHEHSSERTLIGHGFGAQLILRKSIHQSSINKKQEDKIVLINPLGFDRLPEKTFFIPQSLNELARRDELLRTGSSFKLINQDRLKFFDNPIYEHLYEQLRFHPLDTNQLKNIQQPVELIWSANDPFLMQPELPQNLTENFANARLEILKSCGYAPHIECSEELISLIKYSLSSQSPEDRKSP